MKRNYWILSGIGSFSFVFGLLLGASNSPIVGVAITSLFGLAVAIFGFFKKETEQKTETEISKLNLADGGKILLLFSWLLIIGVFLGIEYRNYSPEKPREFIWNDASEAPHTTFEAIDWMILNENLLAAGYSKQQIRKLYEIRLKERMDTIERNTEDVYNISNPLSKLYSNKQP